MIMIKKILVVSLAVAALFGLGMAQLVVGHPFFEPHRRHLAIALGGLGLVAWLIGWFLVRKHADDESSDERRVNWLCDFRYWGPMLSVLGGVTLCIQTLPDDVAFVRRLLGLDSGKKAVAVARAAPPPVPQAPVIFPSVKIQGIVIRDARSAVIVKGRTYLVGDQIDGATIKEITRETVTLEKSSEVKIISLAETTPAAVSITSAGK